MPPTLPAPGTPYYGGGQVQNPANVIKTSGAPSSKFTEDLNGTVAVDNAAAKAYMLVSKSGGIDTWSQIAGAGAGSVSSVTGTASQITASPTTGAVVLSIPAAFVAPGSIAATLGNITATNGNLVLNTAGNKIVSTSVASTTTAGANSFGTVALVGGTATVATSAVTAGSMIHLTVQALGTVTVASAVAVTAKTAATSFVITASQGTDTSTVAWFIIN